MIILHAAFVERRYLLWGETPAGTDAVPQPKRRGRKVKNPPPAGLPFAAGATGLSGALAGIGIAAGADTHQCLVWIPTANGVAFSSSPLIAENPESGAGADIRPWQVNALTLPPSAVLDLLCLCHGENLLAPGVMAGKDLLFWGTALRLAGALVTRQQYLPGLQREGDSVAARWQPVLNADDGARLARLASVMPSACRALTLTGVDAPPAYGPRTLLESA
ncbi:MAG TPA: hypothetical protein VHN12_01065, partial [Geobacteraceae bacterium]|nr:hypothetical protein [Geobacteraceae bacterium]